MRSKLCDLNPAAADKLPGKTEDKSGVGVHYVDAFITPMNTKLPDGTAVKCKRRGLRIMLTAGSHKGDGLLRRLAKGPDPVNMLQSALEEAATAAGVSLAIEDGAIYLSLPTAG